MMSLEKMITETTEKEFQDIYNLEVLVLPTEKPLIRKDLPDLVYQTELSKLYIS